MLSIWLIPQEPELGTLRLLIERVARFTGGPVFDPHITILADIPLRPSEVVSLSLPHIRILPGFELTAHEIGTGTDYFKSLFLRIAPSEVLSGLHRSASRHLPSRSRGEGFEPHVSIAYGNLNRSQYTQVAEMASGAIPSQLRFDEISIVHAGKSIPVERWRCRATISLDRRLHE